MSSIQVFISTRCSILECPAFHPNCISGIAAFILGFILSATRASSSFASQSLCNSAQELLFSDAILLFFPLITAFYHNLVEKAAGNCCFLVKSSAFSYTNRLVAILDCMFSIFDRNIIFFGSYILEEITCSYVELFYEPGLLGRHDGDIYCQA